jgi:hypothetical protein
MQRGAYLSVLICTPHQLLFGDQIEKNEKGGVCSMYGERRGATGFW